MIQISYLNKLISVLILAINLVNFSVCEPIRGLTLRNWPYANRLENGQFEGFVVDVLNEISRIAHIPYTLDLSNQTEYGGWTKNGTPTGVIGQVYRKEADFAIGDITVLSTRARYVQFSFPIITFGLTALIRKDFVGNITTFKELSEQTEIAYGVKKVGANLPLFHDSPVVTKMYNYMDANPSTFVSGEKEGIRRVKTSKYAFITEAPFNEYVINRDCDLTVIDDNKNHFQFEYAIAVRKDLLQTVYTLNDTLRQMKKSGFLDQTIDKYWRTNKCVEDSNVHEIDPKRSAQLSREERDHDKHGKHGKHGKGKHKNGSAINCFSLTLLCLAIVLNVLLFR